MKNLDAGKNAKASELSFEAALTHLGLFKNQSPENSEFGEPREFFQEIFSTLLEKGGDFAELFFEQVENTRVIWEAGKLDKLLDGVDRGLGIRLVHERKSYTGYTTDLSVQGIRSLAKTLASGVTTLAKEKRKAPKDWKPSRGVPEEMRKFRVQKDPRQLELNEKVQFAKRIEKAARLELGAETRQVSCVVLDACRKILVLNSDGNYSPDQKTYFHMICQVVGQKGDRVESAHESNGGFIGLEFLDQVSPESIGKEAARKVKVLLSAVPAPSGTMPVVIAAEAGGTMIHEAVGHGLEADLACNGLSVYQNRVGQQVASPLITVIDDGGMPEKRGSYSYDDEGTAAQKTVLIENGILKGYLVDRLSALKFDMMATGNGRRESFRHKPIVRMTNTYIAPGKDDPASILADTSWGIFVKAMGGGQVNTVTGDFVFAVTEGYLIRNGKLAEPIRGATLVGNGPEVLMSVDRLGNDLGFATGTCGKDGQGAPVTDAQPTLRIPALTVGGEVSASTYWS